MRARGLFPDPEPFVEDFDLPDAELHLHHGFLDSGEADEIFGHLRTETDWEQEFLSMYGREIASPRLTAWYGDPDAVYVYSGIWHQPHAWSPFLLDIRDRIEARTGFRANGVLLNYYRTGEDSVSWHTDDEPELGRDPVIASVSLGAVRTLQMRHKDGVDIPRVDIELPHGSLLMMGGACQRMWQHQLPKRRGRHDPGPRINLTYRRVVAPRQGHH